MSVSEQATSGLADRISEKLFPIHRGAILIGPKALAIFGNDGYASGDGRAAKVASRMHAWLVYKGMKPTSVQMCSEGGYTWVIVAEGRGTERERQQVDRRVWKLWNEESRHKGDNFQRHSAALEIDRIGGGYTDATLETPLRGRAGPVRGNLACNLLMLSATTDNEDVHVVLGGVPFPAKILPFEGQPENIGYVLEWAVITEEVGNPRSEASNTAEMYFAAGHIVIVRDFGQRHESTGRRVLFPVDPQTGEVVPD